MDDVPHGTVSPPAASVVLAESPEGITSATVTLTLPGGHYEVVWGTPRYVPNQRPGELWLDVSLRPVKTATLGFPTSATRTFELWGRAAATPFVVASPDGRQLASVPLTPAAAPPAGLRPVGIGPHQVDATIRGAAAGGLEAVVAVRYGDDQGGVTFGQLVRQGNEFFVDAAATGTTNGDFEVLDRTERGSFALGALEPGTYRLTVRSRTGVVEMLYFRIAGPAPRSGPWQPL